MSKRASLPSVGFQALAVSVPDRIVDNAYWRHRFPEAVTAVEEHLWMWKPSDMDEGSAHFNEAMAPFVRDPFRGAVERRLLDHEDETLAIDFEVDAARRALAAAGSSADDVDLLICTSFGPDARALDQSVGGAAFLARELGLQGAAWNLETACSSMLLAFQTAVSLVQSEQYQRVLLVTSCFYSKSTDAATPIAWGIGDAAVAAIVGRVPEGMGHLGSHSIHSGGTCGAIVTDIVVDEQHCPHFRMRASKTASKLLRETSDSHLRICAEGALRRAGVRVQDLDFCVFNTPLAWYADFCARTLGIPAERTISVYPMYANVGPALPGLNLHHAASWGRIQEGDLVLLYTVGSVSSCCAAVVRWSDVALGPLPEGSTPERLEELTLRQSDEMAHAAHLPMACRTGVSRDT